MQQLADAPVEGHQANWLGEMSAEAGFVRPLHVIRLAKRGHGEGGHLGNAGQLTRSAKGEEGFEPSRPCGLRILSPLCLPFHHSPVLE